MDTLSFLGYMDARDLAWKILIDTNTTTFPVDIKRLINTYNIILTKNKDAKTTLQELGIQEDNDACAIKLEQKYIIYNPDIYLPRLRFSLAHEFGHLVLGHIKKDSLTPEKTEYTEEQANIFASRILAPAIVGKIENLDTKQKVVDFFGISEEAATIRLERFLTLFERDKFLTSPLEKQYAEMYLKAKKQ